MLLRAQPEYLARRFSPSRIKRRCPSIDDVDDDHHKINSKDLMRSADDEVLVRREEFVECGTERECHPQVAAETEIIGPNGTSVREQDERKDGDPAQVQEGH
jgi:hypothetical protein